MPAALIDGVALAKQLRADIAARVARLAARARPPGLAVILVGADPASQIYVRNKVRACAEASIHSVLHQRPADFGQAALLDLVHELNDAPDIDGVLVQLPLPAHLDAQRIIEAIAPTKDVDGLQIQSAGALLTGSTGLRPCTPLGIMKMLEHTGAELAGKHAVVIGRSNTVGKPMALLLLAADATVTICHSKTRELATLTQSADVLVAAVGRPGVVSAAMVKPGAIVIDVGMNRTPAGKLCGDVDFEAVREVAGWITPVPGGVGPMTITMLLANTVTAAELKLYN